MSVRNQQRIRIDCRTIRNEYRNSCNDGLKHRMWLAVEPLLAYKRDNSLYSHIKEARSFRAFLDKLVGDPTLLGKSDSVAEGM